MSDLATITTDDGFTIESRSESAEEMRANFGLSEAAEPAAEESTTDETPAEDDKPAPVADPPKIDNRTREGKKQSIQREIDTATAVKHAARREAEAETTRLAAVRAEIAQLEAQRQQQTQPPVPRQAPQGDPAPKLEDFKNQPDPWAAHVSASARWEARQEFGRQQQAFAQSQARNTVAQQIATAEKSFIDRVAEKAPGKTTKERFDGFFAKLDPALKDLRPTHYLAQNEPIKAENVMADEVIHSSDPSGLLLFLNDHPDDHQRLLTLQPRDLVREIGKITARLEAASTGPAPKSLIVSAAKPPLKPVGGSPVVSDDDADESDLPLEEFVRRGNARDRSPSRAARR